MPIPRSVSAGCGPRTAKLDGERTLPYRPYHTHDEIQPLKPGEVYELDIEIWPTSIVLPKGYRIGLSVRGKDYVYPGFEQPPMPVSGRIYYRGGAVPPR